MRSIRVIPVNEVEPIRRTKTRDERIERYLKTEVEDYRSGLAGVYTRYQDYIRQYRGFPTEAFSHDPVPVRNIEITLGATSVDTLLSQAWDQIFTQSPLVHCIGYAGYEDAAEGFQVLTNHLSVDPYTNFTPATKDYMLDCIMLGTGAYYTNWCEEYKKTRGEEITDFGPRLYAPAPEDLVFPSAAVADVSNIRTLGFETEITSGELAIRGEHEHWDVDLAAPTRQLNPVRRQREVAAHVSDTDHAKVERYAICELFVSYDYDEDGFDEDLYIVWDRVAAKMLYLSYNPFDISPFNIARYQHQAHSFLGMGVMEMLTGYEKEASDWHNFRMANAKLVGSRAWGVRIGSPLSGTKLRIIPNKPLYFDRPDDIKEFRMADVYPSALQTEQYTMTLADRRVGTMTDFQSRPLPGHRTAGVTMQAMLAQINKRFTTAFNEMRDGMSGALQQCVYRMQEQYQLNQNGNRNRIEEFLRNLLGNKTDAVLEVLRAPARELVNKIRVEMTASSATLNREADKQSAMQRLQILAGYYDKCIQLSIIMANPQTPPQVKKLAEEVARRMTNAVGQFVRSFESVRDPDALIIPQEEFDAMVQQAGGLGGSVQLSGGTSGAAPTSPMETGGGQDMGRSLAPTGLPSGGEGPGEVAA